MDFTKGIKDFTWGTRILVFLFHTLEIGSKFIANSKFSLKWFLITQIFKIVAAR